MSIDMTWQTVTTSSEQTELLGEQIGARLRGGEIIELVSDLGGGKTTFVRGIARGAGSKDKVSSPTFTLSREYVTPNFTIVHFDFYRLSEAGIVADELAEITDDPAYVAIVEWGDVVADVLNKDKCTITIDQQADGARLIRFDYPAELHFLIEGLA